MTALLNLQDCDDLSRYLTTIDPTLTTYELGYAIYDPLATLAPSFS